ncbi:MAG: hypothetical protein HYS53_00920 [Candidatus Aenigmarchaeota archaeon]|nr:hypothetical protein [Candidatus Aenigmarchaeota archaeon]
MERTYSTATVSKMEKEALKLIDRRGVAYCRDIVRVVGARERDVISSMDQLAGRLGLVRGRDSRGVYFEPAGAVDGNILDLGAPIPEQSDRRSAQKDEITTMADRALRLSGKVSVAYVTNDSIKPSHAMPVLRQLATKKGLIRRYDESSGLYWVSPEEIITRTAERFRTAAHELRDICASYKPMNGRVAVDLRKNRTPWLKRYRDDFMECVISPQSVTVWGIGERHISKLYQEPVQSSDEIISVVVADLRRRQEIKRKQEIEARRAQKSGIEAKPKSGEAEERGPYSDMDFLRTSDRIPAEKFAIMGAAKAGELIIAEPDGMYENKIIVPEDYSKPRNLDVQAPRFIFAFMSPIIPADGNGTKRMQRELPSVAA